MRGETVVLWKERLPEIVSSYAGGKKSKHRNTIVFMVNAAGGNESKPIVIVRSQNT